MINLKNLWSVFTLLLIGFLTSCQTESLVEVHNTSETITKTSPLTSYLQRVAMAKTAQDNVIDKSSHCAIKLPYIVTVNNESIAINSSTDYQKVLDNINQSSNDNDIVKIDFPVTMIYYDYKEKVIENESDFNQLIAYWAAGPDLLAKVSCLNINYPITINIYNSANQIASSLEISSDKTFFSFIGSLNENQFIALSYPISVNDYNNQIKSIVNNSQFENVIKDALDNCKENSNPSLDFMQILTNNSWKISYYYHDNEKTSIYEGYNFTFNPNYKVIATKLGITYNGTWSTKMDNGVREFEIKFQSDPLKELDEGWKAVEFNNSQLRFNDKENSSEAVYLYFTKN